jgi:hypothetical protein
LDRWPFLRRLRQTPARIDDLTARMGVLEAGLAGHKCDVCGEVAMRLTEQGPLKGRSLEGQWTVDVWTCGQCAHTEKRKRTI